MGSSLSIFKFSGNTFLIGYVWGLCYLLRSGKKLGIFVFLGASSLDSWVGILTYFQPLIHLTAHPRNQIRNLCVGFSILVFHLWPYFLYMSLGPTIHRKAESFRMVEIKKKQGFQTLLQILGEIKKDKTKMVPSKWKTDHLKQINVLWPVDRGSQMQYTILLFWFNNLVVNTILLFWFNDFEVFSLAHKRTGFIYCWFVFPPVDEITEA